MTKNSSSRIIFLIFFFIECYWAKEDTICKPSCGPPPSSSTTNHEWEKYDYYRILDLPSSCNKSRKKRQEIRNRIETQQIKKAYRKQAQLYHPDKAKKTMKEENNGRFARISEAYEVLSNDTKRKDYDRWLLNCEDETILLDNNKKKKGEGQGANSLWSSFRDMFNSDHSSRTWQKHQQQQQHQHQQQQKEPVRVEESQEILFNNGMEILRVHRKEEYFSSGTDYYVYRVLSQDFVEQFVPGLGWEYQPISALTVIEQGKSKTSIFEDADDDDEREDTLYENNYMTPQTPPLVSENGRFYAGINNNCELFVATNNNNNNNNGHNNIYNYHDPDSIIWSSKIFFPSPGGCFLSIQGPYLLLALGRPENPGHNLWKSAINDDIFWDPSSKYFARLDNDGSLVLYKQDSGNNKYNYFSNNNNNNSPRYDDDDDRKIIPKVFKNWFRKKSTTQQFNNKTTTTATCVYSTGAVGCFIPARKVIYFVQGARRSMERALFHIDTSLDTFFDIFADDDILDTMIHKARKAGRSIKRTSSRIAKRSAKLILNQINR